MKRRLHKHVWFVADMLRDLASISVLAAKAMGSFIDDINKEISDE